MAAGVAGEAFASQLLPQKPKHWAAVWCLGPQQPPVLGAGAVQLQPLQPSVLGAP